MISTNSNHFIRPPRPCQPAYLHRSVSISTSTLVASSRFTVAVPQPGGRTWDVEELVAAQLAYIRQLASDAAGEVVRDAVVTVPPFFSQFERDALADAEDTLVIVDDLSTLEWIGIPSAEVSRFTRAVCALCRKVRAALRRFKKRAQF